MKNWIVLASVCFLMSTTKIKACVPLGVPNLISQTISGNYLLLNFESTTYFDCNDYSLDIEFACLGSAFSGVGPFFTTPYFDKTNNAPEAYPQYSVNLAGFCAGQIYQFRTREISGGLPGQWSSIFTFTAPGVFIPPVTGITSAQNFVCAGDSTQLISNTTGCGPGPYNYYWDPPSGLSCTNCPNPMAGPTADITYTCMVEGGNQIACWSSSATINIQMNPASSAGSISSNTSVCAGTNLTVTLNQTAPFFQWESSADGGTNWQTVAAQNNSVYIAGPMSTDDCYRVLVFGCNATYTTNVNCVSVLPVPQVLIMSADSVLCVGESTDLTAFGADTYSWDNGIATGSLITITPSTATTYSLYGSATNGCGNSITYTQLVTICNSLSDVYDEQSHFTLYPNPNSGSFTIETNAAMDMMILNQLGSCVKKVTLRAGNNFSVNCDELPSGMYFIIDQKGLGTAQKLIINR